MAEKIQPELDMVYYSSVKPDYRDDPNLHWPDFIGEMEIIRQR